MIFNLLRQYLKDEEFEQNKTELAETKAVLQEYKEFIQQQRQSEQEEREKVDPDFLTLIWASVGFAFFIFGDSAQNVINLQRQRPIQFYVWSAFTLYSVVFIFMNSAFALGLTRKYARSKSNPAYVSYARDVLIGAALLAVGVLAMALIK